MKKKTCGECPWDWIDHEPCRDNDGDKECLKRRAFRVVRDEYRRLRKQYLATIDYSELLQQQTIDSLHAELAAVRKRIGELQIDLDKMTAIAEAWEHVATWNGGQLAKANKQITRLIEKLDGQPCKTCEGRGFVKLPAVLKTIPCPDCGEKE